MDITGSILFIDPIKTTGEGEKAFKSRNIALDTSVEFNGMMFNSSAGLQATQKNCELLDNFGIGDVVKVTYGIRGNVLKKEGLAATEKNPQGQVCYTSLNMTKIELISKAGTSSSPTPNSTPTSTPTPTADDLPF